MAATTVAKTIGSTGVFSTPQLWEDGAPANLTTAEKSAAGSFLVAAFIQGEALTFVGSSATGKFLDTDSTGAGNGTYVTYGLISGNVATNDVCTGGTSGATCVISSGTPDNVGVIWQGQCQNQEVSTSGTTLSISGSTASSTAYKWITTAVGASFADNANAQTNALRYNASNGAALKCTGNNNVIETSEASSKATKLQLLLTGSNNYAMRFGASDQIGDQLIVEASAGAVPLDFAALTTKLSNSLVVQRRTGMDRIVDFGNGVTPSIYNCSFVAPDDLATAPTVIFHSGASGTITVQNCGLFAGDSTKAIKDGSGTFTFTTCYSDISGTTGVTQATYANEFVDVNDATRDYRLKAGAAEIGTATPDSTNAAFDIVGTARPQAGSWDCSCWEILAAVGWGVLLSTARDRLVVE